MFLEEKDTKISTIWNMENSSLGKEQNVIFIVSAG